MRPILSFLALVALPVAAAAQPGWQADPDVVRESTQRRPEFNYQESRVPSYQLPGPLVLNDGEPVTDAQTWLTRRRPEVLELFRTHVYGRAPIDRPPHMAFTCYDTDTTALDGLATRKQIAIALGPEPNAPILDLLIYQPNHTSGPAPAFILLNFYGNHTIHPDPQITLSKSWMRPTPEKGIVDNRATEASRGASASRFPLQLILKRGYALATMYYGDIDPDFHDDFQNGVHGYFDRQPRTPDAWASITAWAWGLSRAMDYFETDTDLDQSRITVLGHSRLGKTALWAGAQDQRFAIAISNESGRGGAALSRRRFGETVARINRSFPHWFCRNFRNYDNNEPALPLDQHMLISLIAPRPVYVASADRDLWCDPRGEFLAAQASQPVYALFGLPGLGVTDMPPLDSPANLGHVAYHVRSGSHDLTEFDWRQYLDYADRHFAPSP